MDYINHHNKSADLSEKFLNKENITKKIFNKKKNSLCKKFSSFCSYFSSKINITSKRKVYLNHMTRHNKTKFPNKINNQKYNLISFLPVLLFNQFSYFSNQFYLLMVITQFFDILKVGFLFSYLAPLIIVLTITIIKEAYDDFNRFLQDKITNNKEYTILIKDEINNTIKKEKVKSQDIKIGDIIELNKNEISPVDLIILKTSDISGTLFIRTDQLDGETDWKLRKSPIVTQNLKSFDEIFSVEGYLECLPPSKQIYDFKGCLNITNYPNDLTRRFSNSGSRSPNKKNSIKDQDMDMSKKTSIYENKIQIVKSEESPEVNQFNGIIIENYFKNDLINQDKEKKINFEEEIKEKDDEKKSTHEILTNYDEDKDSISSQIILRKEPLSLENTIWASTVLATNKILGIVIFTGLETRCKMNSSNPRTKKGKLDLELNSISKMLFIIMLIISLIITLIGGIRPNFLTILNFFRFVVLFCAIIPISLATNLDIAKAINSYRINNDGEIFETIVRNSTIPEELGRITYIFSDKTGTLTQNEMNFKKLFLEEKQFSNENFDDLKIILKNECKLSNSVASDLLEISKNEKNKIHNEEILILSDNENEITFLENINTKKNYENKRKNRDYKKLIRDTITCMALCNNVTPLLENSKISFENNSENLIILKSNKTKNNSFIREENKDNEFSLKEDNKENFIYLQPEDIKINYQASSPDEIALVKTAYELNIKLIFRNDFVIKILNANNFIEEYEILANFPFTSEKKRMGILLRNKIHNFIIFYVKGAESEMIKIIKKKFSMKINEDTENLATEGLRTLVFAFKIISEDFFEKWAKKYKKAKSELEMRNEKINKVMYLLENEMDFLGITGVEDILQEEVGNTIESFRNGGIKFWVLTGDKLETSISVAKSAHIINKSDKIMLIGDNYKKKNVNIKHYIYNKINTINEKNKKNIIIIIEGNYLEIALDNYENNFFEIVSKAPAVICCRCSPLQKARIVKFIKKKTNQITCSIGDGGNDVAMIQQADIGIGLVGKEGLQASLAADYSTTKFKNLNHLIFWLGRLSYKNTATVAKFVIHRGLIISLIQFIFSIIFYNLPVPIFNGWLILGYSSFFTNLPVISLLLDTDSTKKDILKFPILYKSMLKGRELSIKYFFIWLFKSIFQAAIIMIGSVIVFNQKIYLKIATIAFTVLIFAELLNVYLEIKTPRKFMLFSLMLTLIVYVSSLYLLNSVLNVYIIKDFETLGVILFLTFISWVPFRIYQFFKNKYNAHVVDKVKQMNK